MLNKKKRTNILDAITWIVEPPPIGHKFNSKSSITSNSLLYKGIFIYSKIDQNLKTKNIKQFKNAIKTFIGENLPTDRLVQQSDYG